MSAKTYLTILKIGIFASLLVIFLVFNSFFFPFISSKQITFNVLMEILLIVWLVLIVKYPEYRPKKNLITIGLAGYLLAIFASAVLGADFNLSFWGDVERMLGLFSIIHFFIFYLILITAFRTRADWQNFFLASVLAALIVSLYSFKVAHSTIGNRAYVAGYLIFNIFFAYLLFAFIKNWLVRAGLIIFSLLAAVVIFRLDIAGAYVGLAVGVVLALFISGLLHKNKKIKIATIVISVLLAVIISIPFVFRSSAFIQNNPITRKITYEISGSKDTFQTRLISWRAAAKDFPDHPFFGTGHGTYALIFDKHFDPKFYDYTRSETYFDRAHNNIIDIVSTTGIFGLLTYFSVFLGALFYLWQGRRQARVSDFEFTVIVSLLAAYFIQNLAVFDSLVTYISLMAILAFVAFTIQGQEEVKSKEKEIGPGGKIILLSAIIIVPLFIYYGSVKPVKMIRGVIQGQIAIARDNFWLGIDEYKKAFSYNTVLDRDGREAFVRMIYSNAGYIRTAGEKDKVKDLYDFAIAMAEKNIIYNEKDSLLQTALAEASAVAADFVGPDNKDFSSYIERGRIAINKAIEASPRRIPLYYTKARIEMIAGNKEEGYKILDYAYGLNTNFFDTACETGRVRVLYGEADAYDKISECLDKGGAHLLSPASFVASLINHYALAEDAPHTVILYERLVALNPKNTEVLTKLAGLYSYVGEIEKAKETARRAAALDKSLEADVDAFIKSLETRD